MQVLVVDAANVVGSRPDGWWRDRRGAARKLQARLCESALPYDEVVLVLEGEGRGGSPEGRIGRVLTIHAAGSGDEAILDLVSQQLAQGDGRGVVVATADRGLRSRVEQTGGSCVGPSWLLQLL